MDAQLNWLAEDVLRAVRGQCLHEQTWTAHGVAIDSRTIKPGDLFIAIKGPNHDAHDHVGSAFAAGAAAAIVHRAPSGVAPDQPLVYVDDTFTALQDLGRVGRARAQAKVLAVTGSVGKTSTKEMLRMMLAACGPTSANEGTFNNHWGVPLSLARLPDTARFGVFEIGMNHAGELGPLSREVSPAVSLITNVEAVHLEFFASIEAIADAKAEIFLGMKPDGTAVLNRDNPHYARLLAAARTQGIKNILSFGQDPKSDARLVAWQPMDDGSSTVQAVVMDQKLTFTIGVPGQHIAINALGALLAAQAAGADLATAANALAAFRPVAGRGARDTVDLGGGRTLTLIDESYNASPVAVRAAIQVLAGASVGPGGRRIMVLGDMRELGDAAPMLHAGLAEDLAMAGIDCVHCCGPMMDHLYMALPTGMRGHYAPDSAALAPQVAASLRPGDVVVVKGSKSMLMPKVVAAIRALADCQPSPPQRLAG